MAAKPSGWLSSRTALALNSPDVDAKNNTTFIIRSTEVTDWINGETELLWNAGNQDNSLSAITGLLDDPAEATQEPLVFDLSRNHLVVLGNSVMGKTTLLRTILISLAAEHSPDELHVYVLDLGGRNFRSFEIIIGAVLSVTEDNFEMRFNRLLDFLSQTIVAVSK